MVTGRDEHSALKRALLRLQAGPRCWGQWGCALLFLPMLAHGQATATSSSGKRPLSFEVASIKRFYPGKSGYEVDSKGPDQSGLHLVSNLEFFFELGFGMETLHMTNVPAWAKGELYEVIAKTSAPSTPPEVEEMVRTLLADRFKLITHSTMKEQAIFSLKLSKRGLKMRPVVGANPKDSFSSGPSSLHGVMSTSQIAYQLTADLRRPVVDNTGLSGSYQVNLNWTPDMQVENASNAVSETSVFTAIQEQLGLKLEPAKGQVQLLVIDHVERPGEN